MKGIILAGGKGTRLYPLTKPVIKQLLPVYDKPMIYYPLSTLMMIGIKEILIISSPKFIDNFKELLKDGSQLGISLSYDVQDKSKGIADAFIIGRQFIGNDDVALILGDNIFYGERFPRLFFDTNKKLDGAFIFGYYVKNPQHYGVVEFDKNKNVLSLEEKPQNPKSNFVVPGLYFYDNKVIDYVNKLVPSKRGELEITDLNNVYMKENKLKVEELGRGIAWFDAGSHEELISAANFIMTIESRQNLKIGCIEEVAYRKGFIDLQQLKKLGDELKNIEYGQYLLEVVKREKQLEK